MIIDPYKLSFFPRKIIIEWNCSGEPELNFPIFGQFRHLCRYQMSCKPSLANIARTLRRLPVFTTIHCYSTKSKVKVLINKISWNLSNILILLLELLDLSHIIWLPAVYYYGDIFSCDNLKVLFWWESRGNMLLVACRFLRLFIQISVL